MKILLTDDHSIVRAGLRKIISDQHPSALIHEAGDKTKLYEELEQSVWDILILDISLGSTNSFNLIPKIRHDYPKMKIIILSMHDEKQIIIKALRLGVNSYVTKDRAPEELLSAISAVMKGTKYICQSIQEELIDYLVLGQQQNPHEQLSQREYEVFLLIAAAQSVTEIAQKLNLSVKTISTYRVRILEKMNLENNAQIMRYALDHNLIM